MNNAVLIAGWLPTIQAAEILNLIIQTAENNIPDITIFCGINPSLYAKDWIKYHPQVQAKLVDEAIVINSDTSAYQAALQLYSESGKKFDNVWFMHTKGANSKDYRWLHHLLHSVPRSYHRLNNALWSKEYIGAVGDMLVQHGTFFEDDFAFKWKECPEKHKRGCPTEAANVLDKYFNLPYSPFEYFYAGTWYAIKAYLLDKVLNNTFLYTKLDGHLDKGIYFMERDFIHIVDRQGYIKAFNRFRPLADLTKFGMLSNQEEYYKRYKKEFAMWTTKENLQLPLIAKIT